MQRATLRFMPSAQAGVSRMQVVDLSSLALLCEGITSNTQLPSKSDYQAHLDYAERVAQQAAAGQLRLAERSVNASNNILRALNAMSRWPFHDSAKHLGFAMYLGVALVNILGGLTESASLTPAFVLALLRSGFLASLSRQVAERADAVRDRLRRDPHSNQAGGTPASSAGRIFLACLLACQRAACVLRAFEAICDGRAFGQHSRGATGSPLPVAEQAREAVVSSNLVEHTCRGLLLLLQLPQALDPDDPYERRTRCQMVLWAITTSWRFTPPLYGPRTEDPDHLMHVQWFPQPWHPQLRGPSCQHLTLALGLHVLRSAGGPEGVYGLPEALEKALEEALREAASPEDEHGGLSWYLPDILQQMLGLLAWHLENVCSRRCLPAAGESGTAASGSAGPMGGTTDSSASGSTAAAAASSTTAAAAAAAAAAPWPWRHAVRPRRVWDIAVRVVRMALAVAKVADGDGGGGTGGDPRLQLSLERFKGVNRTDLSRTALRGLATLQLAIWRRQARQEQAHMRVALTCTAPDDVGAEGRGPGSSTAAPLVQGQEVSARQAEQPASSGHPKGAVGLGQKGMCRELGAGQGQEQSSGRAQEEEEEVVRQDVRMLSEWYGLAMEVARYVVHVSAESHQLGLAAQLALQMPRMPEDPGASPVRPPAKLRAALAGGYLPGLERLLRYVGQVPYSYAVIPISRYLCYAASADGYGVPVEHLEDNGSTPTGRHSDLPWLVCYGGEPRHVASLVVTLGKLVWAMNLKAGMVSTASEIRLSRPGGITVVVPMRRALFGLRDCAVVACGDVLRVCSSRCMLGGTGAGSIEAVRAGGGSGGGGMAGGTSGMGETGSGGGGGSSSSSLDDNSSGNGAQRVHMAVFAIAELLPRLAQGLNEALLWVASNPFTREPGRAMGGAANGGDWLVLLVACLLPFLRAASVALHGWLCSCKAVCDAAGGEGTAAAAAAAADGSWRQLLLRDVKVPRVLGHVLYALPHLPEGMRAEAAILAVGLCSVLVEAFPAEVRGSAVSSPRSNDRGMVGGGGATASGEQGTGGGSGAPAAGALGQGATAGEAGGGQGQGLHSSWCPEKLLAAAGTAKVVGGNSRTWRRGVDTALRISAWASGVDVSGQPAEGAGPSDRWGALLVRAGEVLPVCWKRGPLPSPAEAAAVVFPAPRCGLRGCINMEGDSEEGLRGRGLRACGRCGTVRYCSKECQAAHWKAGHKQECGREQQQEQNAGAGSGVAEGASAAGHGAHGGLCGAAGEAAAPAEEGEGGSSRTTSSSSMGAFFALLEDVVGGRTDAALARLRGPDGKTLARAADMTGLAALHWAAAAGDIAVVSELLALGADIEAESEAGTTALKMATAHANMDVACLLMEHDFKSKGFPLGDWAQVQRELGALGARLASGSTDG